MQENSLLTTALFSVVFYAILRSRLTLQEKIYKTRKLYSNRTFTFLEGKLDGVVSTVYLAMVHEIKTESTKELEKQLLLYHLMLRDIFLIGIKNKVRNNILENGYHDFNSDKLKGYCVRNGTDIHSWVTLEVGLRGINLIPDLLQYLGEGDHYSRQDAIDAFTEVIKADLFNEDGYDEEVRKLKKIDWKFWKRFL